MDDGTPPRSSAHPQGQRALYAAFDRFPSPKGAATHIEQMATTLFARFGGGLLYVLGGEGVPAYQLEGGIEIVRFHERVDNLLERAVAFAARLDAVLDAHASTLELCHFRDPWSGTAIIGRPERRYRVVYEVNGLPSIELPYTFPMAAPETLAKVRTLEDRCLDAADLVITPSHTLARHLVERGCPEGRITVIPNGADVDLQPAPPPDPPPGRYVAYVGALQRWQGVETLLQAFARLADLTDLHLVIVSASHRRMARPYQRLADRLGVTERVRWEHGLPRHAVAGWLAGAAVSVAPLADCTRNTVQGCSPLKILESMAAGTPVVASDLPAVRELIEDGRHGRLIVPDRPAELARAIRVLLEYPEQAAVMGAAARARVASMFTWAHARAALDHGYEAVLTGVPDRDG